MPLSEHEERILAEIERGLSADDPRFVQRTKRAASRDHRQRDVRLAAVGFVVGVASLLSITFGLVFGLLGVSLMFGSVLLGARALKGGDADLALGDRLRRALGQDDHHPS